MLPLIQSNHFFSVYEKLKNNNSYLAKALSQEKQNSQSVFSQNIALIAEVQELRLACNTRNVSAINIDENYDRKEEYLFPHIFIVSFRI